MTVILASMPIVECPHCGKEWQWDDYYNLHSGSVRTCPKCEKDVHVLSVDTVMYARLSTEPEVNG